MSIDLNEVRDVGDYCEKLNALDFENLSSNSLRKIREGAHQMEAGLSFYRRLVQGWLDLVQGQDPSEKGIYSDGNFLAGLAKILARQCQQENIPHPWAAPAEGVALPEKIDALIKNELGRNLLFESGDYLENLLSAKNRIELTKYLIETERRISSLRHQIHELIDKIQGVLVMRYRSGDAKIEQIFDVY